MKGGGEPIWIWGRHEVELALGAGLRRIHEVLIVEGRDEAVAEVVVRKARERGAPVRRIARAAASSNLSFSHATLAAFPGVRSGSFAPLLRRCQSVHSLSPGS